MAVLQTIRITKSPRAKNWGIFKIEIDDVDVQRVLGEIDYAVSAESLLMFLRGEADRYFQSEIVQRFAFEGDQKSGSWPALASTTEAIRSALGYPPDHPINEREGELLEFVTYHRDWVSGPGFAEMDIPGDPTSDSVAAKLLHAQRGLPAGENPWPGVGDTPPRPVLATGYDDMAALLKMLEMHIMTKIAVGLP